MLDAPEQIANVVVALLGIAALTWGFLRWRKRPRFICGVPPLATEREEKRIPPARVGSQSVARGFRHRPDCFARRFRNTDSLAPSFRAKLRADTDRCRILEVADRRIGLPIVLANTGARVATDYRASIILYSEGGFVHLVDVLTETLTFGVYADDTGRLSDDLKDKAIPPEIASVYEDYMSHISAWGDSIFLRGNLEAGMHELVFVVAEIDDEPHPDEFFLVFTLDCSDGWLGSQSFIQACVLRERRNGNRDPEIGRHSREDESAELAESS